MDGDRREVPRPLADLAVVGRQLPCFAAVVGAVQPALFGLDHGVDALRVGRGDRRRRPCPTGRAAGRCPCRRRFFAAGRASGPELLPGVAAVAGDVQAAAWSAADQVPRLAAGLPHAGEEDARVVRVDGHVRGAGVDVLEQHAVPRSCRRPWCDRRRARRSGRRHGPAPRRRRCPGPSDGRPSCRSGRPVSRRASRSCRRRWIL